MPGNNDLEELFSSGEGKIYAIRNAPAYVIKKYHEDCLTSEKQAKIDFMIENKLSYPGICFPLKQNYGSDGRFLGYTMLKADGLILEHLLLDKFEQFNNWSRVEISDLLFKIIDKTSYIHGQGFLIGDVKPSNILVTEALEVYFVDTDSYQIGNMLCPVGTDEYTAPELLGKDFKSTKRTLKHELFAFGVLIFKILMLGQHPYAHKGGGSPAENIKLGEFAYPFGDDVSCKAPAGPWEIIWNNLPFSLKEAFYNTFKGNDDRTDLSKWKELIVNYRNDLSCGKISTDILPIDRNKVLNYTVTTKINTKKGGFGDACTKLNNKKPIIGVIELSTRAVKFLCLKDSTKSFVNISSAFDFNDYHKQGLLTNTGDGLDANNVMDMDFFSSVVCPRIGAAIAELKSKNVNTIYTVATAAYRGAINCSDILELIKQKFKLNVRVLSKEEESKATLSAFLYSGQHFISDTNNLYLLIDQGGGSTELTFFKNKEYLDSYSLSLGSTVLKNILFSNSNISKPTLLAAEEAEKIIISRLNYYYNNNAPNIDNKKITCISVGTAITKASGKRGNSQQHGMIMTRNDLKVAISKSTKTIVTKYETIGKLKAALDSDVGKDQADADTTIIIRLGLLMYLNIMDKFKIDSVMISGTGLWYGVFFDYARELMANGR